MADKKPQKQIQIHRYSIDKPTEVSKMALVLKDHIKKNNLSMDIVGKQYVMVEGWQFAGGLMGLFPKIVEVENISPGKWMAHAEIIDKKTGAVVSTGYAICSKEESKKKSFDEYAIVSMAQTRAIGKAFRNLIGWVIKMGGYESTPAEEMKTVDPNKENEEAKESSLNKLKKEVFKAGATNEKEAIALVNKKTGLKLNNLKLTEKHAQIVLFRFLEAK